MLAVHTFAANVCRALLPPAFALMAAHCDEALPPRNDPAVVLVSGIRCSGTDVIIRNNMLSSGGNIILWATNVYDDVLSEQERLTGTLRIEFKGAVATLHYTESDLLAPSTIYGSTLTLLPHDTLSMVQQWVHMSDDDKTFWTMVTYHKVVSDKETYFQSDTAWLDISGSLQLFSRVQPMKLPSIRVPFVYYAYGGFTPPGPSR